MQNSKDLADLYRIRFNDEFLPRKREIWKVLCKHFFQKFVGKNDVVVDVACGYGEFINNIYARKKIGIDLNRDSIQHLNSDIEFHSISADSLNTIGNECADVLFTSNFLEHLPDKTTLNSFLNQVLMVLKPGGRYIIMGPNLRYLPGKYWDFYDHHLGLTHLSLCEALELKGFRIERCLDRFLPYTTQGSLPTHPFLVKIYLMVPFAWKLLGKQFFIIAKKPS
jgi:SAM-dependent methyltransferase